MSESLLKALLKLFAIVVDVSKHGVTATAKEIISSYLNRYYGEHIFDQYGHRFDDYLKHFHPVDASTDVEEKNGLRKNDSHNITQICQSINDEFEHWQKIWLIIELLEFISDTGIITLNELDIVKNIARQFKINDIEFRNCRSFILGSEKTIPRNENVLIISDGVQEDKDVKYLHNKGVSGKIFILHIESTGTIIFRYFGKKNLHHNGHNIKVGKVYTFGPGSVIRNPKIESIYYTQVASKFIKGLEKSQIEYIAKDIRFKFKGTKDGIYPFSFKGVSGELIGILGGSGSGKSTLLNVLNGKLKLTGGNITINGYDLTSETEDLRGVIGYVPQDDLLIEELTVYENLYYNARLCFKDHSKKETEQLVEQVLVDFDLVEAKNLKVGNPLNKIISGGQRKRLNIGLELMREPSILLADEPTSGLSSMDSEKVMNLLKRQSLKGKLVICIIHQPASDIFKLFDKLLVIDQGGRIIYNGNPVDAMVYFKSASNFINPGESECLACGNINTEQILRIVEAREVNEYGRLTRNRKRSAKEWHYLYKEKYAAEEENIKPTLEKSELPENLFNTPGRIAQFFLFLKRNIRTKLSNRQYMLINMLEAPILAFILAYCSKYFEHGEYIFKLNKNLPAYFLMMVIVALFIGLVVSAEEIFKDRRILLRESFLNLSRLSYLNSKVVVLFLISAIQSLLFTFIGVGILKIQGMFFYHWLLFFSCACCSNMIGLNISSAFKSAVAIYITIPIIIVPQLLFSGVVIKFDQFHQSLTHEKYVPFIGDVMPSRWAYEALMVNQYTNNAFEKHFFEYDKAISDASYQQFFLVPFIEKTISEQLKLPVSDRTGMKIIRNELIDLSKRHNVKPGSYRFLLNQSLADDQLQTILLYTRQLKKVINDRFQKMTQLRNNYVKDLIKKNGKDAFLEMESKYTNTSIEQIVLNKLEIKKLEPGENLIVRKKDPVYHYPDHKLGRAHFYAPVKRINNQYIQTYWFNTAVIWIMTFLFYFLLISGIPDNISGIFIRIKYIYKSLKKKN